MKKMDFNKQFENYYYNAIVQKEVAKKLLTFIDKSKKYDTILELGCGTGIFTKIIKSNLIFSSLDLNDIFDTTNYFDKNIYRNFFIANMESVQVENNSLMVYSYALQWAENVENIIKNI